MRVALLIIRELDGAAGLDHGFDEDLDGDGADELLLSQIPKPD